MSEPAPDPPPATPRSASDFEVLRELLVGTEQKQVARLQTRVDDPATRARDIGEVLSEAVTYASSRDHAGLGGALSPAVETALRTAIARDPSSVVGAVFPIIGPAIRRAVSDALGRLVQNLNTALEYGFSWRGWKWRWEAWRTGRSFADVVLCHTLVFRVEEVFLIHRHTGLLLQHVHAPDVAPADSSMVAAMLSAIQDFIRQSFRAQSGGSLDRLQLGDLQLWVENGPLATLAAVVRGHAPMEYRTLLERALEHLHLKAADELRRFQGDTSPFASLHDSLEDCLQTEYLRGAKPAGKKPKTRLIVVAVCLGVLLLVWGVRSWQQRLAWAGYLDRLDQEEGLLVMASGRNGDGYWVKGLRDALAPDPTSALGEFGLDPKKVSGSWEPYYCLSSNLLLKRVETRVPPPEGVTYRLRAARQAGVGPGALGDAVLVIEGEAPGEWLSDARARLQVLPGIREVRVEARPPPLPEPGPWITTLREAVLYFGSGTQLLPDQVSGLDAVVEAIQGLAEREREAGEPWVITVVGHTDASGPAERNPPLSLERARAVIRQLVARGVSERQLVAEGRGSTMPLTSAPDEDSRRNRRVTFEVTGPGDPAPVPSAGAP